MSIGKGGGAGVLAEIKKPSVAATAAAAAADWRWRDIQSAIVRPRRRCHLLFYQLFIIIIIVYA